MKVFFIFLLLSLISAVGLILYGKETIASRPLIVIKVQPKKNPDACVAIVLRPSEDINLFSKTIVDLDQSIAISVPQVDTESIYKLASEHNHETFLELDLEPDDFPITAPKKHTLLIGIEENENISRLGHQIGNKKYTGVINTKFQHFIASSVELNTLLTELNRRKLIFINFNNINVDNLNIISKKIKSKMLLSSIYLEGDPSQNDVDNALNTLTSNALLDKKALGIFPCTQNVVSSLKIWLEKIKTIKNLRLVPASAI